MNDLSRRQWLRSAGTLGVAATIVGTASAQGRLTADDLVRTVKGARLFDLSFTWSEPTFVSAISVTTRSQPRSLSALSRARTSSAPIPSFR